MNLNPTLIPVSTATNTNVVNSASASSLNAGTPPVIPATTPAPPPDMMTLMAQMTNIMARMAVNDSDRNSRLALARKPKAIHCRIYKLNDSWNDFITHFGQCVRAAYAFELPRELPEYEEACRIWLPSKLEPGPTLVAYDALEDAVKGNWTSTVDALADAFQDEAQKEIFLADPGAFRRQDKTLNEYKNELLRRMRLYQPELENVTAEFNRATVTRFIEGLDDDDLRKQLRRHCKRDKLNIESAFNFALDFETSNLQNDLRDGNVKTVAALSRPTTTTAAMGAISATPSYGVNASSSAPSILRNPHSHEPWFAPVRQLEQSVEGILAKQKIQEMQVHELNTKAASTNDSLTTLKKEVGDISSGIQDLTKAFKDFTDKVPATPSIAQPPVQPQQYYRAPPRMPWQGGNRFMRPIRPSITGNVGYINNQVRPQLFRRVEPNSNAFVRPSVPASSATTATSTAAATAPATTATDPTQAVYVPLDLPEAPGGTREGRSADLAADVRGVGVVFSTPSLTDTIACLEKGGVEYTSARSDAVFVLPGQACGLLVEFTER